MAKVKRIENWDIDNTQIEPSQPASTDVESEFSDVGGPVAAMHQRLASELGVETSTTPVWQYELTGSEALIRNLSRVVGLTALVLGFLGAAVLLFG